MRIRDHSNVLCILVCLVLAGCVRDTPDADPFPLVDEPCFWHPEPPDGSRPVDCNATTYDEQVVSSSAVEPGWRCIREEDEPPHGEPSYRVYVIPLGPEMQLDGYRVAVTINPPWPDHQGLLFVGEGHGTAWRTQGAGEATFILPDVYHDDALQVWGAVVEAMPGVDSFTWSGWNASEHAQLPVEWPTRVIDGVPLPFASEPPFVHYSGRGTGIGEDAGSGGGGQVYNTLHYDDGDVRLLHWSMYRTSLAQPFSVPFDCEPSGPATAIR